MMILVMVMVMMLTMVNERHPFLGGLRHAKKKKERKNLEVELYFREILQPF